MTAGKDTGTVFFNGKDGQYGKYYKAKDGPLADVILSIAKSGDLQIKDGKESSFVKPKTNDNGSYYIAELKGKRYFVSERTNSRGPYMMAKPAADRPQAGAETTSGAAVPDRPTTYGARTAGANK
jgi:hypothetical protein